MHSPCGDETYVIINTLVISIHSVCICINIHSIIIHMLFPGKFKVIRMVSDGGDYK